MQITVVDYGSGNLKSVAQALRMASIESAIDATITVSAKPDEVAAADGIILPGVGAFGDCKHGLYASHGMKEALDDAVITKGRPFLGICVGMQLMAGLGLEGGTIAGLGWIDGVIAPLAPNDARLKIPHMGWNSLNITAPHPIWHGLEQGGAVYFLHSYGFTGGGSILAQTQYGGTVAAAIGSDNRVGVQFHPEKSQTNGLRILANWLKWKP